jgi:DNA-binding transcriptional ArsR family regulator
MKTATDELSMTFAAHADPTRRAILDRLRAGEATLGELAEPFEMSLQAVALHLKVLERTGLVTRGRAAKTRPARIAAGPLGNATQWLLRYREFWEGSFDRLDGTWQTSSETRDRRDSRLELRRGNHARPRERSTAYAVPRAP